MGPAGIDPATLFLARDLAEVGDWFSDRSTSLQNPRELW